MTRQQAYATGDRPLHLFLLSCGHKITYRNAPPAVGETVSCFFGCGGLRGVKVIQSLGTVNTEGTKDSAERQRRTQRSEAQGTGRA